MDFSLWKEATLIATKAIQSGARQSLDTSLTSVSDAHLSFHIHQLSHLTKKPTSSKGKHPISNPFLPHDPALYIGDIGSKHKCLLNKYNVLDDHLLLVTKAFEEQQSVLTLDDFSALQLCMSEGPALAFYNSGEKAGASQQHKHIQLIQLPKAVEQLIPFAPEFKELHDEVPRTLPSLPFQHAAIALPSDLFTHDKNQHQDAAIQLKHLYDRLRMTLGIEIKGDQIEKAYNLLLTQEWMLLVPRTKECFTDISLNALAFCGSILVKDEKQAQHIIHAGLANALYEVS